MSDKWQELGHDSDEKSTVVADIKVRGDMPLDLRFASTERDEHAEGEELTRGHVDTGARLVVAEAVGRAEFHAGEGAPSDLSQLL